MCLFAVHHTNASYSGVATQVKVAVEPLSTSMLSRQPVGNTSQTNIMGQTPIREETPLSLLHSIQI